MFGHMANKCRNRVACLKCGEKHKKKECREEQRKGFNCTRANNKQEVHLEVDHSAFDRNCSNYLRAVEKARKRVQYSAYQWNYIRENGRILYNNIQGLLHNKTQMEMFMRDIKPLIVCTAETPITREIEEYDWNRRIYYSLLSFRQ